VNIHFSILPRDDRVMEKESAGDGGLGGGGWGGDEREVIRCVIHKLTDTRFYY
jgi:hypothetical protein